MNNVNRSVFDYLKVSFFGGNIIYFVLFMAFWAGCVFLFYKLSKDKKRIPVKSFMGIIFAFITLFTLMDINTYLTRVDFMANSNKYAIGEIQSELGRRFVQVEKISGSIDKLEVITRTPLGVCTSYFNFTSLLETNCGLDK
ncbi:hypothetical protein ACW6B4_003497 [Yersinia ruckeri]|uniref:hypothetical protein n=1 Tax=Yersinia ruckeri TaxID=29486 RepID=UPI0005391C3E|nr:hypothetical protein [Yersinia ruckeri]AUQ43867.1 hypothetical protein NJ56_18005 [Yersinia ruckeri]WMS07344.1 hypothetical protein RDY86_17445 [Yersinia ruckeri]